MTPGGRGPTGDTLRARAEEWEAMLDRVLYALHAEPSMRTKDWNEHVKARRANAAKVLAAEVQRATSEEREAIAQLTDRLPLESTLEIAVPALRRLSQLIRARAGEGKTQ